MTGGINLVAKEIAQYTRNRRTSEQRALDDKANAELKEPLRTLVMKELAKLESKS